MANESFQSVSYRLLSPEQKAVAEANAKASGMASGEEYIKSRGGVNVSGYYGDSYVEGRTLTDQEYADVITKAKAEGKTSTFIGAAVNAATQQKAIQYYLNNPSTIPNQVLRNQYSSGQINKTQLEALLTAGYADAQGIEAFSAINTIKSGKKLNKVAIGVTPDGKLFYGYDAQGKPILNPDNTSNISTSDVPVIEIPPGTDPAIATILKTLQDQNTALLTTINKQTAATEQSKIDTAAAEAAAKKEKAENAIAVLTDRFNKYGLGSLVPKIRELAISGASEATITLQLQETEEYARRFKANQARLNKGLQVLSPAEYLNLEDGYRQILRAYGLNQFDTDSYVNQFIENDVSAKELSDRVVTAVQRVRNADPAVSRVLREFYGISDSDLVAYVLDPNQQFPKIQTQVAAAEIGAAAKLQGIEPGVAVAEQLARQGITQAEAQRGYATIANILPQAEKLSDIYGNVLEGYGLAEAEQEVFNTLASAQRKRQKLAEREAAAFAGSSGLGRTSLTGSTGGTF